MSKHRFAASLMELVKGFYCYSILELTYMYMIHLGDPFKLPTKQ